MLVFISDLHFVDGSAGEHNVPKKAFEGVFEDLATYAKDAKARTVKIVYLGDIYDLVRTEMWFDTPKDQRPWAEDEDKPEIEQHANKIFDAIIQKNRETFEFLKGDLGFPKKFSVERIYVAGNHDRLCAKYPSLLKKAREFLGIPPDANQNLHYYHDPEYGVFARHGHEWDPFNYEGGETYTHDDYIKVPIGDPITTELVAKLPFTIMKKVEEKKGMLDEQERKALKRNLQEIENVRPLSATIKWLFYQVRSQKKELRDLIEASVDKVIEEFNQIKFVDKWIKKHDRWMVPDEADKLQAVLFFLRNLRIEKVEKVLPAVEKVQDIFGDKDPFIEAAQREFLQLDSNIYYVLYGHTHEPIQVPIQVVDTFDGRQRELVYINTGTWRTRHREASVRGFISWKTLTYTILYNKKEDLASGQKEKPFPTFETWTGALKETWLG